MILTLFLLNSINALAKLKPHVIAQVFQYDGCMGICPSTGARLLDNGRIEEFKTNHWIFMGKVTAIKLKQVTAVTNAIIQGPLYTNPDQPVISDIPVVDYEVRNIKGETVLIGHEADRKSYLMQGGASSMVDILKGLRSLSTVSN